MPKTPPAARALVAALVVSGLSACSGPRPAEPEGPATVSYPASEPAPDAAAQPAEPTTTYEPPVEYASPAPEPREVDGYRVQVYASQTAAGAEDVRTQAEAWWADEQRRGGYGAPFEAFVVATGGLYKVRMGAFTTREDAEAALSVARTRFPDAFLVPDRVAVDG